MSNRDSQTSRNAASSMYPPVVKWMSAIRTAKHSSHRLGGLTVARARAFASHRAAKTLPAAIFSVSSITSTGRRK